MNSGWNMKIMMTTIAVDDITLSNLSAALCWYHFIFSIYFVSSLPSFTDGWRASADNARLYFEDDEDSKRVGAWCATDRENQWLQVDLGKTKKIRAIATQGDFFVPLKLGLAVTLSESWFIRQDKKKTHVNVMEITTVVRGVPKHFLAARTKSDWYLGTDH